MAENKLTGGRTNYYLVPVLHPQREDQPPYQAECEDIAEALQMTPNEFCEFKALWRTAAARLDNGKPGTTALYDAQKRVHYAQRDVLKYSREKEVMPGAWVLHTENKMPLTLRGHELVEVMLKDNSAPPPRPAGEWAWQQASETSAIVKWRRRNPEA